MTSTTSNIKVTYFFGRGKAQMVRILLKYLNVEFENIIVDSIDAELRTKLPYGQLPIYEATVNGEPFLLAQTNSICHYIAENHGFAGKTLEQRALSSEVVNGIWDLIVSILSAKDAESKAKLDVTIPKFLNAFELKLTKNKFVTGEESTYADLLLFTGYDYIEFLGAQIDRSKYPKLESLKAHFDSIPSVIDYKKNLPVTKF